MICIALSLYTCFIIFVFITVLSLSIIVSFAILLLLYMNTIFFNTALKVIMLIRFKFTNETMYVLKVTALTKKVEQLRCELEKRNEEQEDSVNEVKRRHEREKAMMLDDNKKLMGDVERVRVLEF